MAYTGYVGPTPSMCFCGHAALDHSIRGTLATMIGGAYAANATVNVSVNGTSTTTGFGVTNVATPTTVAAGLAAAVNATPALSGQGISATSVGPVLTITVGRVGTNPSAVVVPIVYSMSTSGFTAANASTAGGCAYCVDGHALGPENSRVAGMTPTVLNKPN